MAVKLRKPILIGGLGLSVAFWLWDSIQHSLRDMGEYSILTAIALGGGLWLFRSQKERNKVSYPSKINIDQKLVAEAISEAETTIAFLETEAPELDTSTFREELEAIDQSQNRESLNIAIIGSKRVGKTTLTQLLSQQNNDENTFYSDGEDASFPKADLVLFLINGDVTASQWQIISEFKNIQQRVLVIFNKQDLYSPEEKGEILQKIRSSLAEFITINDIISLAAAPSSVKIKKHLQDGSIKEEIKAQKPDLVLLKERLTEITNNEKQQLIWATTWREAKKFKNQAQKVLNQIRNTRSQPIVEQYQWIAATATFANPVSALDLLATAAINTQMLIDLGEVYQQKISFERAQNAAATIGKLMVKLGIVELSTQAIASILKSNAISYVAGGILQAISAAYLTRIAGLSLIAYYEEQDISISTGEEFNLEKLSDKIKAIFTANQKSDLLRNFVKQLLNNKQLKLNN